MAVFGLRLVNCCDEYRVSNFFKLSLFAKESNFYFNATTTEAMSSKLRIKVSRDESLAKCLNVEVILISEFMNPVLYLGLFARLPGFDFEKPLLAHFKRM